MNDEVICFLGTLLSQGFEAKSVSNKPHHPWKIATYYYVTFLEKGKFLYYKFVTIHGFTAKLRRL